MSAPAKARQVGLRAEKDLMKRLGAEETPGSGSGLAKKGDGRLPTPEDIPDILVECKATTKATRSVQLQELAKIAKEAQDIGRMPVLAVVFCDEQGRVRRNGSWLMVREQDWDELMESLEGA